MTNKAFYFLYKNTLLANTRFYLGGFYEKSGYMWN